MAECEFLSPAGSDRCRWSRRRCRAFGGGMARAARADSAGLVGCVRPGSQRERSLPAGARWLAVVVQEGMPRTKPRRAMEIASWLFLFDVLAALPTAFEVPRCAVRDLVEARDAAEVDVQPDQPIALPSRQVRLGDLEPGEETGGGASCLSSVGLTFWPPDARRPPAACSPTLGAGKRSARPVDCGLGRAEPVHLPCPAASTRRGRGRATGRA